LSTLAPPSAIGTPLVTASSSASPLLAAGQQAAGQQRWRLSAPGIQQQQRPPEILVISPSNPSLAHLV